MPCRVAMSLYLTLHCRHPELLELQAEGEGEAPKRVPARMEKVGAPGAGVFGDTCPLHPQCSLPPLFPVRTAQEPPTPAHAPAVAVAVLAPCTLHSAPLDNLVIRAHFDLRLPCGTSSSRPHLFSSHQPHHLRSSTPGPTAHLHSVQRDSVAVASLGPVGAVIHIRL